MWDRKRGENIRVERAGREGLGKMEVRYQRLDGKMGVTVMIDDRCDLAAYMGGVWEAYMGFGADVTVLRAEACKIEAGVTHTSHDRKISAYYFDSYSLLL